jgi:hypothetical protein
LEVIFVRSLTALLSAAERQGIPTGPFSRPAEYWLGDDNTIHGWSRGCPVGTSGSGQRTSLDIAPSALLSDERACACCVAAMTADAELRSWLARLSWVLVTGKLAGTTTDDTFTTAARLWSQLLDRPDRAERIDDLMAAEDALVEAAHHTLSRFVPQPDGHEVVAVHGLRWNRDRALSPVLAIVERRYLAVDRSRGFAVVQLHRSELAAFVEERIPAVRLDARSVPAEVAEVMLTLWDPTEDSSVFVHPDDALSAARNLLG